LIQAAIAQRLPGFAVDLVNNPYVVPDLAEPVIQRLERIALAFCLLVNVGLIVGGQGFIVLEFLTGVEPDEPPLVALERAKKSSLPLQLVTLALHAFRYV
jgi:hypothetical protein